MLIAAPVLCLVCEQRSTRLERHLRRVHAMTVEAYRAAFPVPGLLVTELTDDFDLVNGRPQLRPGAKRCDGRDADHARQYQRDRRAGLRRSAPAAPVERDPVAEAERDAMIRRLIHEYWRGRTPPHLLNRAV
jgi:hypothetical protein